MLKLTGRRMAGRDFILQLIVILVLRPLLTSSIQSANSNPSCSTTESSRQDCGYFGITSSECLDRNCCWQPAREPGQNIPWCYFKHQKPTQNCSVNGAKLDCGYVGVDQEQCKNKGCCWEPAGQGSLTPWCFYSSDDLSQYNVTDVTYGDELTWGLLKLARGGVEELGADVEVLKFEVFSESAERVRIRISDAVEERWEVPKSAVPRNPPIHPNDTEQLYSASIFTSPFGISIVRKSDNDTLFNTQNFPLVFKDQYIQWSMSIPSSASLYGLGERTLTTGIRLPHTHNSTGNGERSYPSVYTLWNRDSAAHNTDQNLYGSHPILLDLREGSGNAHGVFLLNSNGMDVVLKEESVTYRVIGGVLDFYIFLGPTPEQVIQQYTQLIGRPALPPYWSLGFHQCKYGYRTISEVSDVVQNYSNAQIPLEAIWMDINHMDKMKDFTLDPVNFAAKEVAEFVDQLHSNQQKIVPIVDPGIAVVKGYPAYENGVEEEIFVKNQDGSFYVGQVWPGPVHFPDFFNPKTQNYWYEQLSRFHQNLLAFDGIWIDMNEVSNFCTGESCSIPPGSPEQITWCYLDCPAPASTSALNNPPYKIANGGIMKLPIYVRTMPLDVIHYDGISEYNVHNLYGHMEAKTTYKALQNVTGSRPFVLTRSTFPGTGAYAAHWTGDNGATWQDLQWSITGVLNSNLFGIPFSGADICGFLFHTTEELCRRWIQVGAFYPFSRDHSDTAGGYQELYRWPSVAEAARNVLGLRYRLLPYLYTLFYQANQFGGSVMRPLFFEFPTDTSTYNTVDQFMWGSHLLFSPILEEGADSKTVYFPDGVWYCMWTYNRYDGPANVLFQQDWLEFQTPVFLRAGGIIPTQQNRSTVTASRATPFTITSAIDKAGKAFGQLYWDEGDSVRPRKWLYVDFESRSNRQRGSLFVKAIEFGPENVTDIPDLERIVLLGIEQAVDVVKINDVEVDSAQIEQKFFQDLVEIKGLAVDMRMEWKVEWTLKPPVFEI